MDYLSCSVVHNASSLRRARSAGTEYAGCGAAYLGERPGDMKGTVVRRAGD